MELKKRVILFGILLILSSNITIVSIKNIFPQTRNIDQLNLELTDVNEQPIILDETSSDNYFSEEKLNQESSINPSSPTLSASTHPLTKDETQLINLEEIAHLPDEEYCGGIFNDVSTDFQEINSTFEKENIYYTPLEPIFYYHPLLHILINVSLPGFTSGITAGDVDGDGTEEVVIATEDNYIKIYDDAQHSYSLQEFFIENPPDPPDINLLYWSNLKTVTCGDVDGDGIDEIALLSLYLNIYQEIIQIPFFRIINSYNYEIYLWVFDVVEERCLHDASYLKVYDSDNHIGINPSSTFIFPMEPEVAMGDLDEDGLDEIVCGYSQNIWIFDDYNHSFNLLWSDNLHFENQNGGIGDVDLACGDFDGDRKDEIAYTACIWNGAQLEGALLIIDESWGVSLGSYGVVTEFQLEAPGGVWVVRMPVTCGDIDGDGRDEIGLVRSYREEYSGDVFIYEYDPSIADYKLNNSFDWDFPDFIFTMGDVDCDGLAELVFSGRYGNHVVDDANHGFTHIMNRSLGVLGLVVCGDFDGDGMRVKYTGESWINTAPPGVIAVLAGPPVYHGIQQNYDWSWTAFGKLASISTTETEEIGVRSSSTISFSQTLDILFFEAFSFSWSRTVGKELARTKTATMTQEKAISYFSGCWVDSVIYHLTDYYCYKYQIIHHPFNSAIIGQYMTIDVPISPTILKTSLDYFEEHYNQSIRAETFNHTLGQPWTYPTRNETANFASEWLDSGDPISVGQGTGNNLVNIKIENVTGEGFSLTKFSDYSIGASVCGLGFSTSQGTSDTKGYEISIGETCIYEGSIGDIRNPAKFDQLQYSIGLFIYYVTHPDGFTYQVINYYVEGASVYMPSELVVFLNSNWQWIAATAGGVSMIAIAVPVSVKLVQRSKTNKTKSKKTTKKSKTKKTKKSKSKKTPKKTQQSKKSQKK
ncbi:MAG TPA: VCBS repeat-containing protein [candidate division Zixibacteria bacterium]|nr:VCBS repeat-containing protein [candidate division Zixibacteria bacterium]